MKRHLLIGAITVAALGFGALLLRADPPAARIVGSTDVLMHAKLTSAQNVLEGLVREDFEKIGAAAREMRRISEAAAWPRRRDTIYEHYGAEFRRRCLKLEKLAESGNHEGASFTYIHLTTLCISCHQHVRHSQRIASQPGRRSDVQLIPAEWPEQNLPKKP